MNTEATSLVTRISRLESVVFPAKKPKASKVKVNAAKAKPVKAARTYRIKVGRKASLQKLPAKSQLVALYMGQQKSITQRELVTKTRMRPMAVAGAIASLINRGVAERVVERVH